MARTGSGDHLATDGALIMDALAERLFDSVPRRK